MAEKKRQEQRVRDIKKLAKKESNKECFNCRRNGPQNNVCLTFSTFVCAECAGVHRSFGHKVKSINMSKFTDSEVSNLKSVGNRRARREWMAITPNFKVQSGNADSIKGFMDKLYNQKEWHESKMTAEQRKASKKVKRKKTKTNKSESGAAKLKGPPASASARKSEKAAAVASPSTLSAPDLLSSFDDISFEAPKEPPSVSVAQDDEDDEDEGNPFDDSSDDDDEGGGVVDGGLAPAVEDEFDAFPDEFNANFDDLAAPRTITDEQQRKPSETSDNQVGEQGAFTFEANFDEDMQESGDPFASVQSAAAPSVPADIFSGAVDSGGGGGGGDNDLFASASFDPVEEEHTSPSPLAVVMGFPPALDEEPQAPQLTPKEELSAYFKEFMTRRELQTREFGELALDVLKECGVKLPKPQSFASSSLSAVPQSSQSSSTTPVSNPFDHIPIEPSTGSMDNTGNAFRGGPSPHFQPPQPQHQPPQQSQPHGFYAQPIPSAGFNNNNPQPQVYGMPPQQPVQVNNSSGYGMNYGAPSPASTATPYLSPAAQQQPPQVNNMARQQQPPQTYSSPFGPLGGDTAMSTDQVEQQAPATDLFDFANPLGK